MNVYYMARTAWYRYSPLRYALESILYKPLSTSIRNTKKAQYIFIEVEPISCAGFTTTLYVSFMITYVGELENSNLGYVLYFR